MERKPLKRVNFASKTCLISRLHGHRVSVQHNLPNDGKLKRHISGTELELRYPFYSPMTQNRKLNEKSRLGLLSG